MCSSAITTQEIEKGFTTFVDLGQELAEIYQSETVAAVQGSATIAQHVEIATRFKGAIETFAAGILVGKEIESARRNAYASAE